MITNIYVCLVSTATEEVSRPISWIFLANCLSFIMIIVTRSEVLFCSNTHIIKIRAVKTT